jgi:hypothetical protein
MNLTTLIQKKETLFNSQKFTKALDDIFGGDFNNKAKIDEYGRLVIQYTSKFEGCVVFVSNKSADNPYIEATLCRSKNPSDCRNILYQSIKPTATLRQFKKFLVSLLVIHYYMARRVEVNHKTDLEIGKELRKLGRLKKQIV